MAGSMATYEFSLKTFNTIFEIHSSSNQRLGVRSAALVIIVVCCLASVAGVSENLRERNETAREGVRKKLGAEGERRAKKT